MNRYKLAFLFILGITIGSISSFAEEPHQKSVWDHTINGYYEFLANYSMLFPAENEMTKEYHLDASDKDGAEPCPDKIKLKIFKPFASFQLGEESEHMKLILHTSSMSMQNMEDHKDIIPYGFHLARFEAGRWIILAEEKIYYITPQDSSSVRFQIVHASLSNAAFAEDGAIPEPKERSGCIFSIQTPDSERRVKLGRAVTKQDGRHLAVIKADQEDTEVVETESGH